MALFRHKSKYNLGMTKDNFEPIDLMAIYEKVKKKKQEQEQEHNENLYQDIKEECNR